VDSHVDFAEEYDLPFPLVADPEHDILTAYGVYGERNLYGNTVVGTKRTTYLIDPDGVIRHVFKRPKTDAHVEEIIGKWDAL
jgi:peroxiredoxin Q/BCP